MKKVTAGIMRRKPKGLRAREELLSKGYACLDAFWTSLTYCSAVTSSSHFGPL
jgi:hypothetical protein